MANTPQIIRVFLVLMGMLVVGIVIGRYSMPRERIELTPEQAVNRMSSSLLKRYELEASKEAALREIITRMEEEMRPHRRGSIERRDIFRRYVPEYRALMNPDKVADFEWHVQAMERKFKRMIRIRERREN